MDMKLRFCEAKIASLAEEYILCLNKTLQQQEQQVIDLKTKFRKKVF